MSHEIKKRNIENKNIDGTSSEENYEITFFNTIKAMGRKGVWIGHRCFDPSTRWICMGGQSLSSIPNDIGQLGELRELILANNLLTSIPEEIGKLSLLTFLNISKNKLTSIPAEIGKLSLLTFLNISKNKLTSIPAEIGKLRALETLDISENQLTSIPAEIGKLTALETLDISENQLTSIPKDIGNLDLLKMLDLHKNQLSLLPPEIGKLSSLIVLDLKENRLKLIPEEIGQLSLLEELYFSYGILWENDVEFPLFFGQLMSLKQVFKAGDCLLLKYTDKSVISHNREKFMLENVWSEKNHYLYNRETRKLIFTLLMITHKKDGIPYHPEAQLYELPKELLYIIFYFICTSK